MKVFETWKRKNPADKKHYNNKTIVNNYYGKETIGEQIRRHHTIHYILKYKLFIPIILIIKKIIGKNLVKTPPNKPHLKPTILLNNIIEEATNEWNRIYINSLIKKKNRLSKKEWKERFKNDTSGSQYLIRTIKELINTIATNDDAYNEYIHFLLWKTYFTMRKEVERGVKDHLMRNVPGEMNPLYEMWYLILQEKKDKDLIRFEVKKAGRMK